MSEVPDTVPPEPSAPIESPEPLAPSEPPAPAGPVEVPEPMAPSEPPAPAGPVEVPEPMVPSESPQRPAAEDPAAEDPAAENPAAEDPTAEDPTAEDPTAEDLAVEDPTAGVEAVPVVEPELDPVLVAALEPARAAAAEVGRDAVGEHLGVRAEAERVATHAFAATLPGYRGWYWAVSVARAIDSDEATVDEVVLLPGDGALLAPQWVPWDERVRPGDLSPGELLPPAPDDERLVPAYTLSDDPTLEPVAFELGLGRVQVMSRGGRLDAAERWFVGEHGPEAEMARQAPAPCGTCGFLLLLAGALQAGFGVCGNEFTAADGQVVSVEYGCGAHSDVRSAARPNADLGEVVYDDGEEITVG